MIYINYILDIYNYILDINNILDIKKQNIVIILRNREQ